MNDTERVSAAGEAFQNQRCARHGREQSTGIQVAEARGIILMALAEAGIPTHEYSPSRLKRAVTGDGRADKKAMQKMIKLELGLAEIPKPDDAADAISLALALASELR